jgi:hypothetical protein
MKYEVWAEGYRTNGESSGASLLGVYEGEDFDSAVIRCMMDPKFKHEQCYFVYNLGVGYHRYWGCRLFDNEADARASFG